MPQLELTDCGAACLASVLAYYGRPMDLDVLRTATATGRDGVDARAILRGARRFGLDALGVKVHPSGYSRIPPAAILHWDGSHFVVFERAAKSSFTIIDPSIGRRRVSSAEFENRFSGVALLLSPGASFAPARSEQVRRPSVISEAVASDRRAWFGTIGAAVLLLVLALGLPAATRTVADSVVPGDRVGAATALLAASIGLAVGYLGLAIFRGRMLVRLRAATDWSLTVAFVERLAARPFSFFQRRSLGDLLMRVESHIVIREILTATVLATLLDGALGLLFLVLAIVADPVIGAVTAILIGGEALVFTVVRRRYRRLAAEHLAITARAQSYLVQLLSGIETLKAARAERRAVEHWVSLFREDVTVAVRRGRFTASVEALMETLRVAGPMIVLATGTFRVLAGRLTLGELLGLSILVAGTLAPASRLVSTGLQLQLLDPYIQRVFEILRPTDIDGAEGTESCVLRGHVTLEDVDYRYGDDGPGLSSISADFPAGRFAAVVGASGAGKSTLATILVGLHRPQRGTVRYDGIELHQIERESLAGRLGVVTQQSYIFGGSIRDNIALAIPGATDEQVTAAARLAAVDGDIDAMPMGYLTRVREGGGGLSGGQRQRIALARALLGEPVILVLDEPTSEVDPATERRIMGHLRSLPSTKIVIAHRPSIAEMADFVIVLEDGRIVQIGTHVELAACDGPYRRLMGAPGPASPYAAGPVEPSPPVLPMPGGSADR